MKTLESERLLLRPVQPTDAPALQRHFAHWSIIQHLSTQVPWPYPEDGVATFLREDLLPRIERGEAEAWAIVPKGTHEAVGLLEWRCTETAKDSRGFWLAEEHHGKGLMTEAVTAFQDYIFFERGIDRIVVHNAVENAGSRRVKEKTGAVFLRVVKMPHHHGNGDAQQWEVTREAWATLRGR